MLWGERDVLAVSSGEEAKALLGDERGFDAGFGRLVGELVSAARARRAGRSEADLCQRKGGSWLMSNRPGSTA
jgi:hypothetical protein